MLSLFSVGVGFGDVHLNWQEGAIRWPRGPLPTPPSIHADVKTFGQDDGLSIFRKRADAFGSASALPHARERC